MIRPIYYIDLFSGCGGISLGLYNAGLRGLFAVEKHPDAFQTLKHNLITHKQHFAWPDWLTQKNWDVTRLLKAKSDKLYQLRGQVDLIVGGPPCQGFSIAGQRRASDKRNDLIYSYLEFVDIIRPKIVLFENVRGFTIKFSDSKKHKETAASEIVLQRLTQLGYTDARGELVNFAEYGVPQRRQRFLVVASLENLSNDVFSMLENNRNEFLNSRGVDLKVGCKAALSDLERQHGEVVCPDSKNFYSGMVSAHYTGFQKQLRLSGQENYVPNSHRFVNHTPAIIETFKLLLEKAPRNKTIKENKELYGVKKRSLMVLDPDEPAPTVTTIPDDFVHYSEPRVMTVRECARLQTFPDWFEFTGPYTTGNKERVKQVPRYTQVGNAVPPLFAEQLGIVIRTLLEDK